MPDLSGTLKPPRLTAAPGSPVVGQMYYNTTTNILYYWNGTAWINLTTPTGIPLVSSLPGSPTDGQEVYYQADAANGINWHLRYRAASASAYKWEFLGGPDLDSGFSLADDSGSSSTTYADFATPGPSITLPLAGDYMASFGAAGYSTVVTELWIAIKRGAAATSDADGAGAWEATAVHLLTLQRDLRIASMAASTVLKMQHRFSVAGAGSFRWRWLNVTPVRVG